MIFFLNDDKPAFHKNTVTSALEHSSHWILQHSGFVVGQRSVDLCLQLGGAGGGCPRIHLLLDLLPTSLRWEWDRAFSSHGVLAQKDSRFFWHHFLFFWERWGGAPSRMKIAWLESGISTRLETEPSCALLYGWMPPTIYWPECCSGNTRPWRWSVTPCATGTSHSSWTCCRPGSWPDVWRWWRPARLSCWPPTHGRFNGSKDILIARRPILPDHPTYVLLRPVAVLWRGAQCGGLDWLFSSQFCC